MNDDKNVIDMISTCGRSFSSYLMPFIFSFVIPSLTNAKHSLTWSDASDLYFATNFSVRYFFRNTVNDMDGKRKTLAEWMKS